MIFQNKNSEFSKAFRHQNSYFIASYRQTNKVSFWTLLSERHCIQKKPFCFFSAHILSINYTYKATYSFSGKQSLKIKNSEINYIYYTEEKSSTTYIYNTSIFNSTIWSNKTSYWESWITVLLSIFHIIAPCYRHVINNPIKKLSKKKSSGDMNLISYWHLASM